jgi:ribosomal protein L11 methyltransferase
MQHGCLRAAILILNMNFIQIRTDVSEEKQEMLISNLSSLGAIGFEQTDTYLLSYFDEENFLSYDVNKALESEIFEIHNIEEKNWNEEWEKNFEPVLVGNFCGVRAHFHKPFVGVNHEIIITPKMSFGTGHHATTFMMIEQMEKINFENQTVLDFGTGTGILAILAEKLQSKFIKAMDIDKWSIENAKENIKINNCKNIDLQLSAQLPDQIFDIILANINRNVIQGYLSTLQSKLSKGGLILFSGILIEDENKIVQACQKTGLNIKENHIKDNWLCLLFMNSK